MMVVFISQCKKKAIYRTQMVLDAFANRIGSRTWQTVITQEGLLEVKRLLSKTASKNTAVSCLWHRSRNFSELLWVVGNNNMFNTVGMVPVNITSKKVFMDEIKVDNNISETNNNKDQFYANSPNKQILSQHLFAVGFVAKKLFEKATGNSDKLAEAVFLAGCLHDIGKVDNKFQDYILKKDKLCIYDEDNQHIDIDNNYDPKSKNYFDKHIRHNELSLLLIVYFEKYFEEYKNINPTNQNHIKHIVYYHHAKQFRKKDINKIKDFYNFLKEDEFKPIIKDTLKVLKDVDQLAIDYKQNQLIKSCIKLDIDNIEDCKDNSFEDKIKDISPPEFKDYAGGGGDFEKLQKSIKENANNNLLRSCLISADRIISALAGEELSKLIKAKKLESLIESEYTSNLCSHLDLLSDKFPDSEFTQKQNDTACELAKINNISVLQGAAGCGKTRIALEWARIKSAQKIIWICPRVQICQGIFEELSKNYLPESDIEIFTSEFKYTNSWKYETPEKNYFSAEIMVTTIDQVLNFIRSHTKSDALLDFMEAHIVFDEFHEYINMDIFNILFAELIANKKMGKNKNTLLVSATPNYIYLKEVLNIDNDCIKKMPSFNKSRYKIVFEKFSDSKDENIDEEDEESIPNQLIKSAFLKQYTDKTTFIISNNIIKAQLGFLYNYEKENSILFHSKFKKSDKKSIFEEIYHSFKQNGSQKYQTLRSGPIIQASLNVSCDYMLSEISTAENILQRLGRLDRFGKNEEINEFVILLTSSIEEGKLEGSCAGCLRHQNIFKSTKAWYKFLQDKFADIENFELNQIYEIYESFYQDKEVAKDIKNDLENLIKKSIEKINKKILDPIKIKTKSKDNDKNIKISRNSLRGDNNRFIQLAKCDVTNYKEIEYLDEYAYEIKDGEIIDNLTDSFNEIFYDKNHYKKNIYEFMEKHFFYIFPDKQNDYSVSGKSKKNIKRYHPNHPKLFFNYAKDPKFPIYLSYIQDDLKQVNKQRIDEFIYYAVCSKQAVGTISVNTIEKFFNNQKEKIDE